jgi:hypothetical protein
MRVPTRVVGAALRQRDDESPIVRISKDDDSVLIIVSCGDAVIERVVVRIAAKGKLSRYVIDVDS